jgi:hypothetical protein
MTWQALGAVQGPRLTDARLQLHWAAQVISAAADGWLARRDDDGHTAMSWDPARRALVGEPAPSGLAIALRPASLDLIAIHGQEVRATCSLAGATLASALAWADRQHAEAASSAVRNIAARDYDMPAHAVREGSAFTCDAPALAEIADWYAAGVDALGGAAAGPGAIPLRVWPHHFDLGTIVYLDAAGERARQIGLGLSPGDVYYAEPYFYVTPYPIRDDATFGPLAAGGVWRREGWTGAILLASSLIAAAPTHRRAAAASFLDSALAGARSSLIEPATK